MSANYVQKGSTIAWTNATGSAVAAGAVVTAGDLLGIAETDIANGAVGTVNIEGVYEVTCDSADVITQGQKVDWDASASKLVDAIGSAAAGDNVNGAVALTDAPNGVVLVEVKLLPGNGTTS